MLLILITGFVVISIALAYFLTSNRKSINLRGKHVIISGGSKGIGREVAAKCYQKGAKVTILARDHEALTKAKEYILQQTTSPRPEDIFVYSVDVSESPESVASVFKQAEQKMGPVEGLFNIVGMAVVHRFLETSYEDFHKMMSINYFSAVNCTKAATELMVPRKNGFIELTSSMAGLLGVYGYSAYSSSKFALLGFAETLAMELKPHNISVTIAFPPDTDTPGFEVENKSKPLETKLISETAGIWLPSKVADAIVNETLARRFSAAVGVEGFILRLLCSGAMPSNGPFSTLMEIFFMGPMRLVATLVLYQFNKIVKDCAKGNPGKQD